MRPTPYFSMTTREPLHYPTAIQSTLMLAACAFACFLAAFIGKMVSPDAEIVYESYTLPSFAPPAWVFGPVWIVMYLLVALAGWLIWHRDGYSREFYLWCAQLVLNALWTPLFFGIEQMQLSLIGIFALWLTVAYLMAQSALRGTGALFLLVPYSLWITFAASLNLAIIILN